MSAAVAAAVDVVDMAAVVAAMAVAVAVATAVVAETAGDHRLGVSSESWLLLPDFLPQITLKSMPS